MAGQNTTGFKRFINSFFFSIAGLKATWKHEEAFRQEVFLFLLATPLAIWITEDNIERVLLIGSVGNVLIIELLNSAVETTIDRIGVEHHELSGRAKDIGSAAVMLSMALVAMTWAIIII